MKKYRIEIWQYRHIVRINESDDINDILKWYRNYWQCVYDSGMCAFDVYEGDREMDFDELDSLGFYDYGED